VADRSKIEWTDASWNPIRARVIDIQSDGSGKERIGWHCEHVSEGCRNCYAEGFNKRLGTGRDFKPGELYEDARKGHNNGEVKLFLDETMLTQPLRWKKPRRIFVGSMTDLFGRFVKDEWLDKIFAVMALCPQHTFQVLTKRSDRMRAYLTKDWTYESIYNAMGWLGSTGATEPHPYRAAFPNGMPFPLPNVWLGVSAEDQPAADARIPDLLATPAAVRFISAEPLLGPINLHEVIPDPLIYNAIHGMDRLLDLVIVGGESGVHARSMHPDWARSLRDQCQAAGVAFFFKQWGEWAPFDSQCVAAGATIRANCSIRRDGTVTSFHNWSEPDVMSFHRVGKKAAGRLLDGVEHNAMPERAR
jgi:protein gp37